MRYQTMSAADATACLTKARAGEAAEPERHSRARGDGRELPTDFVDGLREELDSLVAQFPQGLQNMKDGNRFEALAARAVHGGVPSYPEVVADPEFWIWLAVAHFPDVVEWRYGNPAAGAALANYGIGARGENLLFRSWLRAELVLDEEARDRYHLSEAGQIDFYRSHLFRQGYANAREFARALLRFQYPHKDRAAPNLRVDQIRELVKRLRRMRANLFLEILDEAECRAVIEAEAKLLAPA